MIQILFKSIFFLLFFRLAKNKTTWRQSAETAYSEFISSICTFLEGFFFIVLELKNFFKDVHNELSSFNFNFSTYFRFEIVCINWKVYMLVLSSKFKRALYSYCS